MGWGEVGGGGSEKVGGFINCNFPTTEHVKVKKLKGNTKTSGYDQSRKREKNGSGWMGVSGADVCTPLQEK